jgi:hypothetical protein
VTVSYLNYRTLSARRLLDGHPAEREKERMGLQFVGGYAGKHFEDKSNRPTHATRSGCSDSGLLHVPK